MGAACTSGLTAFPSRSGIQPVKILLIGRHATGKTFLLYSWKYGVDSILSIEPTSHFNVDTVITAAGKRFLVYDLAGDIGLRLRPFLDGTNGVVYMLGAQDEDILQEEELEYIQQLLQERDLENVPILFVIRRGAQMNESHQDLPDDLKHSLDGRVWDLVDIRSSSQEDANLVLKILEKLVVRSHVADNYG